MRIVKVPCRHYYELYPGGMDRLPIQPFIRQTAKFKTLAKLTQAK